MCHAPPLSCVELQVQRKSWVNMDKVLMRMYDGKERDLYSLRYVTYIPPLVRPFTEKTQEELEEWVWTKVEAWAHRVCILA